MNLGRSAACGKQQKFWTWTLGFPILYPKKNFFILPAGDFDRLEHEIL